jgi:uncharacterized membrane protein YqjE
MAVDLHPAPATSGPHNGEHPNDEQSVTKLVAGIVGDAQDLLQKQVTLFKMEVQEDLRLTTQAAISLGIGLAVALVGAIVLAFGLAHLLFHYVPGTPLWVWYLLVGAAVTGIGAVLVGGAIHAFSKINPPLPETTEAIKETVEWQTTPR